MSIPDPIAITVKEAVEKIDRKDFLLPAIQRELVWGPDRIEKLFDSLMSDYPINSFLFWELRGKENIGKFKFYEFLRIYNKGDNKHKHNEEADTKGKETITAVLDGQQRLTALYIGLKGTYAYKNKGAWKTNKDAYPERKLYINLLYTPKEDSDNQYHFLFLTKKELEDINNGKEDELWYEVGEMLNVKNIADSSEFVKDKLPDGHPHYKYAINLSSKLYQVIHIDKPIISITEKSDDLDKVLNMFIRINSGGVTLSYSDLILSIATAQWTDRNAREEITHFVDEINNIGSGFYVNKDFVLKSSLVLSKAKNIAFKVNSFNKEPMLKVESEWEQITKAIRTAVNLVDNMGYSGVHLTSNYPITVIADYLNRIGCPDSFIQSGKYAEDQKTIFKWLVMVLLRRTFTNQPDNVFNRIREVMENDFNGRDFPINDIINKFKGTTKAITFDEDFIKGIMEYEYKYIYTFSALILLYKNLYMGRNILHKDHIFPHSMFSYPELQKAGIKEEEIGFYSDNCNRIANLQLIDQTTNLEKGDKDPKTWMEERFPDVEERKAYMEKHYIPDVDLSLSNFREFIQEREKILSTKYKEFLQIT